ncbi:MAG: DinB family protein [Actinobacteria bacterium]|nr:DinB family protein [Actinomycetota bacterium]
MTLAGAHPDADLLEIFWVPGCSSCLRMKEFVNKIGIPHEAVNAEAEPERAARLADLGLTVPAAVLGDVGVPGVDLVGIAKLVGYPYDPPQILPPGELKAKYDEVVDIAGALMRSLTAAQLDYKSEDRDRSMRQLSVHIGTIMCGFVIVEDTNEFTMGYEFIPPGYAESASAAELADLLDRTRGEFDIWWQRIGFDDPFDRIVDSPTGVWTLHEALERAVWHTAQHVRQLEYFVVEKFRVAPEKRLTAELLAGLPLPDGIHAGGEG